MLKTRAQLVERGKKREKKRARKLKLLATQPNPKPLSTLVREKRTRALLAKITKSGTTKVKSKNVTNGDGAEMESGDSGAAPGAGKAVEVAAADGKIRIRLQKLVSAAYAWT